MTDLVLRGTWVGDRGGRGGHGGRDYELTIPKEGLTPYGLFTLVRIAEDSLWKGSPQLMAKIASEQDARSRMRVEREQFFLRRMDEDGRFPVPYRGFGSEERPHVLTAFDESFVVIKDYWEDRYDNPIYTGPGDLPGIAHALLTTLAELHELGICHCDITPGNALLQRVGTGGEFQARYIDLAHGHSVQGFPHPPPVTEEHKVGLTKGWAPARRLAGDWGPELDVWGVALLVLAFGNSTGDPLASAGTPERVEELVGLQLEQLAAVLGGSQPALLGFVTRALRDVNLSAAQGLAILENRVEVPTAELGRLQPAAAEEISDSVRDARTEDVRTSISSRSRSDLAQRLFEGGLRYDQRMAEKERTSPRERPEIFTVHATPPPEPPLTRVMVSELSQAGNARWVVACVGALAVILLVVAAVMGRM